MGGSSALPFEVQSQRAIETTLKMAKKSMEGIRNALTSPTSVHVIELSFWVVDVLLFGHGAAGTQQQLPPPLPLLLSRLARRVVQVQDVLSTAGPAALQAYVAAIGETLVTAFRSEFPGDSPELGRSSFRRSVHEVIGQLFFGSEGWDDSATSRLLKDLFGEGLPDKLPPTQAVDGDLAHAIFTASVRFRSMLLHPPGSCSTTSSSSSSAAPPRFPPLSNSKSR